MDNINKTPEQQIDKVVESLKALLLSQTRNQQEAEEIKRRLDSLGHEVKAVSAIINDRNIYENAKEAAGCTGVQTDHHSIKNCNERKREGVATKGSALFRFVQHASLRCPDNRRAAPECRVYSAGCPAGEKMQPSYQDWPGAPAFSGGSAACSRFQTVPQRCDRLFPKGRTVPGADGCGYTWHRPGISPSAAACAVSDQG